MSNGSRIKGINHITIAVKDVPVSFRFYTRILNFRPVARWPKGAYLLAGNTWFAMVRDPHVHHAMLPEYTHIAFTVSKKDFAGLSRNIKKSGARIWQQNKSEGASLYFLDPNGHKLEIHASDLRQRIETARRHPWKGLKFFK